MMAQDERVVPEGKEGGEGDLLEAYLNEKEQLHVLRSRLRMVCGWTPSDRETRVGEGAREERMALQRADLEQTKTEALTLQVQELRRQLLVSEDARRRSEQRVQQREDELEQLHAEASALRSQAHEYSLRFERLTGELRSAHRAAAEASLSPDRRASSASSSSRHEPPSFMSAGDEDDRDFTSTSPLPLHDTPSARGLVERIRLERLADTTAIDDAPRHLRPYLHASRRALGNALEKLSADIYSHRGRCLMEIIQNADDNDYPPGVNGTLEVTQHGSQWLAAFHNETGFSALDLKSLCQLGDSHKAARGDRIGRKGIGFKSIFAITGEPLIVSGPLSMVFNATKMGPYGFFVPEWVDDPSSRLPTDVDVHRWMTKAQRGEGTLLFAPLLPAVGDDLAEGLQQDMDGLSLAFLRRLRTIRLVQRGRHGREDVVQCYEAHLGEQSAASCDGQVYLSVRRSLGGPQKVLRHTIQECRIAAPGGSAGAAERSYNLHRFVLARDDTETETILAFPHNRTDIGDASDDGDRHSEAVFAYLPVTRAGLRFAIQADFDLTTSRQDLSQASRANAWTLHVTSRLLLMALEADEQLRGRLEEFLPKVDEVLGGGMWRAFAYECRQVVKTFYLVKTEASTWVTRDKACCRPVDLPVSLVSQELLHEVSGGRLNFACSTMIEGTAVANVEPLDVCPLDVLIRCVEARLAGWDAAGDSGADDMEDVPEELLRAVWTFLLPRLEEEAVAEAITGRMRIFPVKGIMRLRRLHQDGMPLFLSSTDMPHLLPVLDTSRLSPLRLPLPLPLRHATSADLLEFLHTLVTITPDAPPIRTADEVFHLVLFLSRGDLPTPGAPPLPKLLPWLLVSEVARDKMNALACHRTPSGGFSGSLVLPYIFGEPRCVAEKQLKGSTVLIIQAPLPRDVSWSRRVTFEHAVVVGMGACKLLSNVLPRGDHALDSILRALDAHIRSASSEDVVKLKELMTAYETHVPQLLSTLRARAAIPSAQLQTFLHARVSTVMQTTQQQQQQQEGSVGKSRQACCDSTPPSYFCFSSSFPRLLLEAMGAHQDGGQLLEIVEQELRWSAEHSPSSSQHIVDGDLAGGTESLSDMRFEVLDAVGLLRHSISGSRGGDNAVAALFALTGAWAEGETRLAPLLYKLFYYCCGVNSPTVKPLISLYTRSVGVWCRALAPTPVYGTASLETLVRSLSDGLSPPLVEILRTVLAREGGLVALDDVVDADLLDNGGWDALAPLIANNEPRAFLAERLAQALRTGRRANDVPLPDLASAVYRVLAEGSETLDGMPVATMDGTVVQLSSWGSQRSVPLVLANLPDSPTPNLDTLWTSVAPSRCLDPSIAVFLSRLPMDTLRSYGFQLSREALLSHIGLGWTSTAEPGRRRHSADTLTMATLPAGQTTIFISNFSPLLIVRCLGEVFSSDSDPQLPPLIEGSPSLMGLWMDLEWARDRMLEEPDGAVAAAVKNRVPIPIRGRGGVLELLPPSRASEAILGSVFGVPWYDKKEEGGDEGDARKWEGPVAVHAMVWPRVRRRDSDDDREAVKWEAWMLAMGVKAPPSARGEEWEAEAVQAAERVHALGPHAMAVYEACRVQKIDEGMRRRRVEAATRRLAESVRPEEIIVEDAKPVRPIVDPARPHHVRFTSSPDASDDDGGGDGHKPRSTLGEPLLRDEGMAQRGQGNEFIGFNMAQPTAKRRRTDDHAFSRNGRSRASAEPRITDGGRGANQQRHRADSSSRPSALLPGQPLLRSELLTSQRLAMSVNGAAPLLALDAPQSRHGSGSLDVNVRRGYRARGSESSSTESTQGGPNHGSRSAVGGGVRQEHVTEQNEVTGYEAEVTVFRLLNEQLRERPDSLLWVSMNSRLFEERTGVRLSRAAGEVDDGLGYDFKLLDHAGVLGGVPGASVHIEVKGIARELGENHSTALLHLSPNEFNVAARLGAAYLLAVVDNVRVSPRLRALVRDPVRWLAAGALRVLPNDPPSNLPVLIDLPPVAQPSSQPGGSFRAGSQVVMPVPCPPRPPPPPSVPASSSIPTHISRGSRRAMQDGADGRRSQHHRPHHQRHQQHSSRQHQHNQQHHQRGSDNSGFGHRR